MSATDTSILFKRVIETPLIRLPLKFLLRRDRAYNKTYLELGIAAMYNEINAKKNPLIFLSKKVVELLLNFAVKVFEADKEEKLEDLKKPYNRRGLVNILKGLTIFGVKKPFVPSAPFLIVWDYTYRCNLRCKHCYINAGLENRKEMTLDEKRKVLDIMADAGVVSIAFSGGEPLMGVGIFEMIKRATDYGMYTAIATNGTLITEEVAVKLKKAGLGYAQISLDAPVPSVHDEFRGIPGVWERTVRGIKNAKKAGITVEVSMTVTKYNLHLVDKMIELLKELGVDYFMHFNFIPTGRGKNIVEMDISPSEREKLLRSLALRLYSKDMIPTLSTAPQFSRITLQLGQELCSDETILGGHFYGFDSGKKAKDVAEFIGGCGAGRLYIALEPNGDIQPCVFLPLKVGNILEDNFVDLWINSPVFNTLRNRDLLKGRCGKCPYKYICGGCRARAYAYFGDITAPDPGCIYNKDEWEKVKGRLEKTITVTSF